MEYHLCKSRTEEVLGLSLEGHHLVRILIQSYDHLIVRIVFDFLDNFSINHVLLPLHRNVSAYLLIWSVTRNQKPKANQDTHLKECALHLLRYSSNRADVRQHILWNDIFEIRIDICTLGYFLLDNLPIA